MFKPPSFVMHTSCPNPSIHPKCWEDNWNVDYNQLKVGTGSWSENMKLSSSQSMKYVIQTTKLEIHHFHDSCSLNPLFFFIFSLFQELSLLHLVSLLNLLQRLLFPSTSTLYHPLCCALLLNFPVSKAIPIIITQAIIKTIPMKINLPTHGGRRYPQITCPNKWKGVANNIHIAEIIPIPFPTISFLDVVLFIFFLHDGLCHFSLLSSLRWLEPSLSYSPFYDNDRNGKDGYVDQYKYEPEREYNKIHITCNYSRNSLFPPNSLTTTITTAKIANDIITRIIVPMGSTLMCGAIQREIPKIKTANIIIIIIQPKGVGFFHLVSLPIFLTSIIFHF